MAVILFCVLTGCWLILTGIVYRVILKKEYDSYGIEDWLKKPKK